MTTQHFTMLKIQVSSFGVDVQRQRQKNYENPAENTKKQILDHV